jgi:hypothetical protein
MRAMDEGGGSRFEALLLAYLAGEAGAHERLLGDDFVEEYPQSGERIEGRGNALAMAAAHPTPPAAIGPARLTRCGEDLVTLEQKATYGTDPWWIVAIWDVRDGRAQRETAYFADPFAPPSWRAQWVEPIPQEPASGPERHQPVDRSVVERYTRALAANDLLTLGKLRHPDWVADLPQSGERFRGHQAVLEADRNYPGGLPSGAQRRLGGAADRWALSPSYVPLRIAGRGAHWVSESELTYPSGERVHGVALIEFSHDKAIGERWYYCAPFGAPAWRRPWVESH